MPFPHCELFVQEVHRLFTHAFPLVQSGLEQQLPVLQVPEQQIFPAPHSELFIQEEQVLFIQSNPAAQSEFEQQFPCAHVFEQHFSPGEHSKFPKHTHGLCSRISSVAEQLFVEQLSPPII